MNLNLIPQFVLKFLINILLSKDINPNRFFMGKKHGVWFDLSAHLAIHNDVIARGWAEAVYSIFNYVSQHKLRKKIYNIV